MPTGGARRGSNQGPCRALSRDARDVRTVVVKTESRTRSFWTG